MFPFRKLSPVLRTCRVPMLLIAFLAGALRDGLCVAAPPACTRPPAIAARLQTHPDAQIWIDLGNWFGDHRQFVCAQQAFRSGLRLAPASAQLNYLLGLSLYESQEFEQAVPALQRSIKAEPTVIKPHLLLATVYGQLARPMDAEPEWRAALRIDPSSSIALHGLSQTLGQKQDYTGVIALLQNTKLDENLALDLGFAYFRSGQLLDAIDVVTRALNASPDSIQLSNMLVNLYIDVTRTLDAEHLAEKTWKAHPDDVGVQTAYLHTLVINGDWGPAKAVGAKLLAEAPHAFETLYFNGVMERQAGDFAAARDHLTEAIALRPDYASAHANLGMALLHLDDPSDAKAHLDKALKLGDAEPETHFALANALRALNQPDDARQEMLRYQQAVKENNDTILAVSKAGEAAQAINRGEVQHGVELYRQAFAAAPKNALIGYKLAMAMEEAGDTGGEHTVLEQVVALDPTIALAQNQLGYLDSQLGDYPAAEEHFRQAVSSAPAFTQAWISLAATLGVEAKFPEAQQAVASALRLEPGNNEARQLSHDLTAAQTQQPHN